MKFLKCLVVVLFACAIARADRPTTVSVEKLLDLLHVEQSLGPLQAQMRQMMGSVAANPQLTGDLSASQKAQVAKQVDDAASRINAVLTWDSLKPVYVDAYQEAFTQEEVDALIDFYRTPVGRSIANKLPTVTQSATEKVQAKLMPIVEKMLADAQTGAASDK